jgi:hypothetical protein
MKKLSNLKLLILFFVPVLISCEEESTLNEFNTESYAKLENKTTNQESQTDSDRFNEFISAGEKLVYELSSDYIEEVSHNFEEEFNSIEKMDVVRYNDFHLFKITGQNLESAPSVQYYPIEEIEGSGENVSLSGPRVRPCQCGGKTKIYHYYMRPDGTLYLSHTSCHLCPVGLLHALGWI